MRVLFLTNVPFPPREGIGHHLLGLGTALARLGVRVEIFARGATRRPKEGQYAGLTYRLFPYPPVKPFHHAWLRPILQGWLDRRRAVDVVHVHLPLLPPLRVGVPVVVTVHTPMLTDARSIREGALRPLAARLHARLFSRRYEDAWLRRCDLLLAVSGSVARELAACYRLEGRVPIVVPNGVDPARFRFAPLSHRPPVILYAGRLGPRKGLRRLLEAFARLPRKRYRLVLLGDGPLAAELRRRARRLGIAAETAFLGHGDAGRVAAWLRRARCFVLPSDYEGFPLVLLEAMASGAPVVTTPIGALDELGEDPPLRVAAPDPDALAQAIRDLMEDPEAAALQALRARRLVCERFTWHAAATRVLDGYRGLLRCAA